MVLPLPYSVGAELKDPGTLRVGINLANMVLVSGINSQGVPLGVAPDLSSAIADGLGVPVSYISYNTPGQVADGVEGDEWDIALIAIEPLRAERIAFCNAYVEIEATYLIPEHSEFDCVEDVDRTNVRIAVADRTAYDLYLSRTLKHATLCRIEGLDNAYKLFRHEKMDALAGLVPALKLQATSLPGSVVLSGGFMSVLQAIGTRPERTKLRNFINNFLDDSKANGLIADLIAKHGVGDQLRIHRHL